MCSRFSRCCQNSTPRARPDSRPRTPGRSTSRPSSSASSARTRSSSCSREASGSLCRDARALIPAVTAAARERCRPTPRGDPLDPALDAHLAAERMPVEKQRGALVLDQLAALATRVAGARKRSLARRTSFRSTIRTEGCRVAEAVASAHASGSGIPSRPRLLEPPANWRRGRRADPPAATSARVPGRPPAQPKAILAPLCRRKDRGSSCPIQPDEDAAACGRSRTTSTTCSRRSPATGASWRRDRRRPRRPPGRRARSSRPRGARSVLVRQLHAHA